MILYFKSINKKSKISLLPPSLPPFRIFFLIITELYTLNAILPTLIPTIYTVHFFTRRLFSRLFFISKKLKQKLGDVCMFTSHVDGKISILKGGENIG